MKIDKDKLIAVLLPVSVGTVAISDMKTAWQLADMGVLVLLAAVNGYFMESYKDMVDDYSGMLNDTLKIAKQALSDAKQLLQDRRNGQA